MNSLPAIEKSYRSSKRNIQKYLKNQQSSKVSTPIRGVSPPDTNCITPRYLKYQPRYFTYHTPILFVRGFPQEAFFYMPLFCFFLASVPVLFLFSVVDVVVLFQLFSCSHFSTYAYAHSPLGFFSIF